MNLVVLGLLLFGGCRDADPPKRDSAGTTAGWTDVANGGVVTANWERGGEQGYRILRQKDGKYVVFAHSASYGIGTTLLGRFTAAGQPDKDFGNRGFSQPYLGRGPYTLGHDFAIQPDGRIVLAVVPAPDLRRSDFRFLRLDGKGNLDTTFGTEGFASELDGRPTAIALQPDGKVLLAGALQTKGPGASWGKVARFTSDGALDLSFAMKGLAESEIFQVRSLALDARGRIMLAGSTGTGGVKVARLLPTGLPDTSFGVNGMSEAIKGDDVKMLVSQDGKIVLGISQGQGGQVALLTEEGKLDTTFHTTGKSEGVTTGFLSGMAIQPDGKVLLSLFGMLGEAATVVRFGKSGELDPGFGDQGIAKLAPPVRACRDVIVEPDGKISILVVYQPVAGDYKDSGVAIVRLTSAGKLDEGFAEKGLAKSGAISSSDEYGSSMLVQADGKIVVAGNGLIPAVIRFLPDGALDPSVRTYSDSYPGIITARALPGFMGTWGTSLVALAANSAGAMFLLSSRERIVTLWTDPKSDSNMNVDLKGFSASSMVLDESRNQLMLSGGTDAGLMGIATVSTLPPFTQVTKEANPSGSGATPAKSWAKRLALFSDGKTIVAGSVDVENGRSNIALARFDASLALDTGFGKEGTVTYDLSPLAIEQIEAVAALPDGGAIAVGYTSSAQYTISGQYASSVAPPLPSQAFVLKLRSDGSLDPTFATQGVWQSSFGKSAGAAFALEVLPDGKLVIAGQRWEDSLEQGVVVRLLPTGVPDTSFGDNGTYVFDRYAPSAFYALAREASGTVLATGRGFVAPGGFDVILVRIPPR